jgi:hypothetical protein
MLCLGGGSARAENGPGQDTHGSPQAQGKIFSSHAIALILVFVDYFFRKHNLVYY